MLKQRVITALVLLVVLLPCIFVATPRPFAVLTLVFVAAALWEWARLNRVGAAVNALGVAAALAAGAWLLAHTGLLQRASGPWVRRGWLVAGAFWVVAAPALLWRGNRVWSRLAPGLREILGWVALMAAWMALARAKALGINFLLSVLCLVWAADIGAYFGGRAWGRHKLAPGISPGKTWEGAASGLAAVLALSWAWSAVERAWSLDSLSVFGQLHRAWGVAGGSVAVALLVAMSVAGDLIESLVKRQAGVKDSSRLLPGHGGVLDRIDALIPVFPFTLALIGVGHV
jgi:phosphatidate cytidylyltransferase